MQVHIPAARLGQGPGDAAAEDKHQQAARRLAPLRKGAQAWRQEGGGGSGMQGAVPRRLLAELEQHHQGHVLGVPAAALGQAGEEGHQQALGVGALQHTIAQGGRAVKAGVQQQHVRVAVGGQAGAEGAVVLVVGDSSGCSRGDGMHGARLRVARPAASGLRLLFARVVAVAEGGAEGVGRRRVERGGHVEEQEKQQQAGIRQRG